MAGRKPDFLVKEVNLFVSAPKCIKESTQNWSCYSNASTQNLSRYTNMNTQNLSRYPNPFTRLKVQI